MAMFKGERAFSNEAGFIEGIFDGDLYFTVKQYLFYRYHTLVNWSKNGHNFMYYLDF